MESVDLSKIDWSNRSVLTTVALFLGFLVLRAVLINAVKKWSFKDADEKRKRVVSLKNSLLILFLIGLLFVWGSELRSFAISLVAVAAALVIATKEIILCFMGGILKASTKLFEIGDRIEIKNLRGEVTDHNLLVTTLFDIGPGEKSNQFTGKVLKIPNSLFLSESVVVEPHGSHYNLAVFKIPLPASFDLKKTEGVLLEVAKTVSESYFQKATKHIKDICRREGVQTPTLEPRVLYDLVDKDTVEFHIRMPVPFDKKSRLEKELIEMFFQRKNELVVNGGSN